MKHRHSFLLGSALLAAATMANAQSTYYWDSNNGTTGFGNTDGTWSATTTGTSTRGWTTAPTGNTIVNGNSVTTGLSDTVNFGTSAYAYGTGTRTVTVSGTVNVGTIVFGNTSIRTNLSGGTINLGSIGVITSNISPASGSGSAVTISSAITGAGTSLTINGGAGTGSQHAIYYTGTFSGSSTINLAANTRWDQSANQTSGENLTYNVDGYFGIRDLAVDSARTFIEIGELTGSGTVTRGGTANDGVGIIVGGKNTNSLFTGAITSNTSLEKVGTGTLTLSGTNNYTDATIISGGTLALDSTGSFSNSPTIVVGNAGSSGTVLDLTAKSSFVFGSGQTVKGIGTINLGAGKDITINGTLAKGNSIGTQTYTGNLILAGNDNIELGNSTGAGSYASPYNSDLGNVSGNLTLGGTLNVIDNATADGNGSISAGSYKIYTYGGTASGSYTTINNAASYRADIVDNGAGTGSGQGIYLDNYRVAAAASTQTVTLNTRTGISVSTSLSLTNTNNAAAPFQETLGTTGFSGTTSGFSASGSATGIAGGASGSGTLQVGVDAGIVGTAGTYSGFTTLGLQTEEVNSSGLGNAGIGNQVVTINVNAYDYASADFSKTGGAGSFSGSGTSYTLDFGAGLALNTTYTATLQLANGLFSLYKDSLQGTYGTVSGPFSETAGNFASLTSGGTDSFTVSFYTGTAGTFTDTLTFNGTSLNTPLGNSTLNQISIGITATAIPEPSAVLLGGLGLLMLIRRRR